MTPLDVLQREPLFGEPVPDIDADLARALDELRTEVEQCGEGLNHWLRKALRYTAHGFDFEIPHAARVHAEQEQTMLERWVRAGFLVRGAFDPDWSQRAFALVGCTRKCSAREYERLVEATHGSTPTAYWYTPGPNAALALEVLPPVRGLAAGDVVRYTRSFVRSIGGDEDSRNWTAVIVDIVAPRTAGKSPRLALIDEGLEPGPCSSCEGGPPSVECSRCRGTGRTHLRLINLAHIERVPSRSRGRR